MKHYYCQRLNETIVFDALKLFYCCATRTGPSIDALSNINNINNILKVRNKLIKKLAWGNLPEECKGCFDLKESNFTQIFKKINKTRILIIKHFKQCDCQCMYCSEKYLSHRKLVLKPKKSDYYDLYPIIKEFYKKNLLDEKNLEVVFQGGNISVLEEFEDLVNIFVEHNVKRIEIAMNGIKYIPILEKICDKTTVDLDISIDCGCRETFKRMKTVDGFDSLIENLKKYSKMPIVLRLKYILIKGVNDNIEELSKYIDIMHEIGIKISELYIDQCDPDFDNGKEFNIPAHYYDLFEYWKKRCNELNIYPSVWSYIQEILDRKKFFK